MSNRRLSGIDAPEKGQRFGNKAREALGDKVFQQSVRVDVIDIDRYRREVGRIYLGERFINMEMVADGFAWRYVQYDKPGEFTAAEADAHEHRRGLCADPNPIPPWEWRKAQTAEIQIAVNRARSSVNPAPRPYLRPNSSLIRSSIAVPRRFRR